MGGLQGASPQADRVQPPEARAARSAGQKRQGRPPDASPFLPPKRRKAQPTPAQTATEAGAAPPSAGAGATSMVDRQATEQRAGGQQAPPLEAGRVRGGQRAAAHPGQPGAKSTAGQQAEQPQTGRTQPQPREVPAEQPSVDAASGPDPLQPWQDLQGGLDRPLWSALAQRAVAAVIQRPGAQGARWRTPAACAPDELHAAEEQARVA